MKLEDFLAQFAVKQNKFAEKIGVSPKNLSKYCLGVAIPRPQVMRKIFEATGGLVDANSFYLLQDPGSAADLSASGSVPVSEDENAALSSDVCRSSDVNSDEREEKKS